MKKTRFGRLRPPVQSFVAGVAVDGDYAQLVIARDEATARRPVLVMNRATTVDDLPRLLEETKGILELEHRGAIVQWSVLLGGDAVHHEVVQVPPQIRAFPEARLEASLACTRWGNLDAVEASGCRVAHVFDDDWCLVGVAGDCQLGTALQPLPSAGRAVSAAAALVAILRMVNQELFETESAPAMALLLDNTAVAAAIVERGRVRLLFQCGLLEYFRDLEAPRVSARAAVADGPLEFELGGSYPVPGAREGVSRIGSAIDLAAADVESEVYQASTIRVIQDVLSLYAEQYGSLCDTPERLLLTGDSVTRHALRAYLARQLGTQFEVDEIDAALAVRIDEPGEARRIAASQNSLGGALCALAAGLAPDSLQFDLDPARPDGPHRGGMRAVRAPRLSRAMAAGIAAALLVVLIGATGGLVWTGRTARLLAESTRVERERQQRLKVITDERETVEARLAHTRAVLGELERLRGRQALPPELLAAVRAHVPASASLDELSLANGVVRIVGSSERREAGVEFALSLEQMRDTFADVTPQVDTVPAGAAAAGAAVLDTYTFTITARYVRTPAVSAGSPGVAL